SQVSIIPAPDTGPLPDDATGMLFTELVPGRFSLLVALANLESGATNQPSVLRFDRIDGQWVRGAELPGDPSSPGELVSCDLNRDGPNALIIAGGLAPGRYPEPAGTRVYLNHGGRLEFDPVRSAPLSRAG